MLNNVEIKQVEVSGEALLAFIKGLPDYLSEFATSILYKNNIQSPEPGNWYAFDHTLEALEDITKKFGHSILYEIGKGIVDCALLPKGMNTFTDALNNLQAGYDLNHKNGSVCKVKVVKLSMRRRRAIVHIENPYPIELNRGILAGVARKFTPKSDVLADVEVDEIKSLYPLGVFKITW